MEYSQATQRIITYIEEQLVEEIALEFMPNITGYSKFHLSRIFKQETGLTIGEYIRMRRLAMAASSLIYSNASIITIAFTFQFQSQEAFTRAFKEVYALPPGKYRKLMQSLAMMEEEKLMELNEQVTGWMLSGANPELYQFHTDDKVFHSGKRSGVIFSTTASANNGQFATMMQGFQAADYKGKRLKMSCYLKTAEATKCGAWMRIDNATGDTIQFDNMDQRSVTGTTEWNHYSIILDVPEEGDSIYFGVLLIGTGKVWADGFRFEEVNDKVASTNMLSQERLPKQPANLDFSME
ncbi:helix-turn-helix transcriptional regulator [Lysinibacillus sp. ZYM-1]|uniref:helix-turn-helix transcriptional regulator n=1 Tax=Lysinibacillus sp. ZYM-1 TaxID=1681184 RepID=UPI0006CE6A3F|nr:AraC family transcriptional regulator [Lysinibacillus sp. ZYM-1]KPN95924.1 transcriptional regulator [Lysinibacillus sp. ZYM-1]